MMLPASNLQREYTRSLHGAPRSLANLALAVDEIIAKVIEMQVNAPLLSTWSRSLAVSFLKSIKQELSSYPGNVGRPLLVSASTIAVAVSVLWDEPELLVNSVCHLHPDHIHDESFLASSGRWEEFLTALFGSSPAVAVPHARRFQHASFVLYAAHADEESLTQLFASQPLGVGVEWLTPASLILAGDLFSLVAWCRLEHRCLRVLLEHLVHHVMRRKFEQEGVGGAFRPAVSGDTGLPLPDGMRRRLSFDLL